MSKFKPIETQEEFDEAIKDRLEREREKAIEPFSDYETLKSEKENLEATISTLNAQIESSSTISAQHEAMIAELTSKNKGYETNSVKMRIALENGLPFELSERLSGEDEESIRKDAERLSTLFQSSTPSEPPASTEGDLGNQKDAEYKALLKTMSN